VTSKQVYDGMLARGDAAARLGAELSREDERQAAVHDALRAAGIAPDECASYARWDGFSGGAAATLELVDTAAAEVRAGAARTGAQVPEFHCGLWPDPSFNAWSVQTAHGNVVCVSTGLLRGLRHLAQAAIECFPEILSGAPGPATREHRDRLQDVLADQLSGTQPPHRPVPVLGGAGERMRRELQWGGLLFVIAHETGHLARARRCRGGWEADLQAWQAPQHRASTSTLPLDEHEAVRAARSEVFADDIACRVLHELPLAMGEPPPMWLLLGPLSALALQAALWWRRAALTDELLGWRHPVPDTRAWHLLAMLGADPDMLDDPWVDGERNDRQQFGPVFWEWCRHVLQLDRYRAAVTQRGGLSERGVDPVTLVQLTVGDPSAPPVAGSDILASVGISGATPR
jgi:hypothetical protein